jgi:hypothetical protein
MRTKKLEYHWFRKIIDWVSYTFWPGTVSMQVCSSVSIAWVFKSYLLRKRGQARALHSIAYTGACHGQTERIIKPQLKIEY